MLEPVFQFIEKFVTDFSWRRLTIVFSFISIIAASFVLYEWQTSAYELARYERSTLVLKELDSLISSENREIRESAKIINSKIQEVVRKEDITSKLELSVSPEFAQIFFAILPWLLIALILIPNAFKNKEEPVNMLIGFIMFIFIVGFLAYFIPTDWSKLARYGGAQLFNIVVLALLARWGNRK
jgi:hypothetical protein